MKKNAIIVLGVAELNGIKKEYPELVLSSEIFAVTPDAYEQALNTNSNIKYPIWVQKISTWRIEGHNKVEKLMKSLEVEAEKYRKICFEAKNHKVDWNYMSNYFIGMMVMCGKKFAEETYENLNKYDHVYIPTLNHSGEFYFDSNLQSTVLNYQLRILGIKSELVVLDFRSKSPMYRSDLYEKMPDLNKLKNNSEWLSAEKNIIIAAAAMYSKDDQAKLAYMLKNILPDSRKYSYPLPLWQVFNTSKEFSDECSVDELINNLKEDERIKCFNYVEKITELTEEALIKCFEDADIKNDIFFRQQIQRLRKRHLLQTLTYIYLNSLFKTKKPDLLYISLQDSTINGPIANAAIINNVDIIEVPHSRVINWNPPCKCLAITEWWQPRLLKTIWGEKVEYLYIENTVKEEETEFKNYYITNKWVIIYNGIQENLINTVSWSTVKEMVSIIKQVCQMSNIELCHRLKPGDQTPLQTYVQLLDLDIEKVKTTLNRSLNDLILECDLIISLDEPSSALWTALNLSRPVLVVADRLFDLGSLNDDDILKPINLNELKETLTNLSISNNLKKFHFLQQKKIIEKKSKLNNLVKLN